MRIVWDMDGVLVGQLPAERVEEYWTREPELTYGNLLPNKKVIAIMKILSLSYDVMIVTKTAVEGFDDHHYNTERVKKEYAKKYNFDMIPMYVIPRNISKREFVLANFGDEPTLIIDDYGKNCEDFTCQSSFEAIQYGETAYKIWRTARDPNQLLEKIYEVLE